MSDTDTAAVKILFVCTGNSCRSQMAEGFARAMADETYQVSSAGTMPIGILPETIRTMAAAGVDISGQSSKKLTEDMIRRADYVITLCGHARDHCPAIPSGVVHRHWEVDNPDRAYFSDEARRQGFARVRDDIRNRIRALLAELSHRRREMS